MKSEMMQEMMGDAMDDVMDNDEDEEDRIVGQVLDEIGIDMSEGIPNAPEMGVAAATAGPTTEGGGKVAVGLGGTGGTNDAGNEGGAEGSGGAGGDTSLSDLEARL